jgi:hypothetical protein
MLSADLHTLKAKLRTVENVVKEVGICDREYRKLMGIAGGALRASRRTRSLIEIAHERHNPFPLPEHMRLAREAMIPLKCRPGSEDLRKRIVEIEGMLADYEPKTIWASASKSYMLGFTAMSRALHHNDQHNWFGGRKEWRRAIVEAEQFFEQGRITIANAPNEHLQEEQHILRKLDHVLFNNWLVAVAAQPKIGMGRSREETDGILREASVLTKLSEFLNENPFLWQAAWNGLEIASTLKSDDDEMLPFYNKLKELDSGFQSFDYSPGEVPSISGELGMAYFCERFRDRLHVDNPEPTTKKKG